MQRKIFTEPQTGREYAYLPNPWTRPDGVTVSPLTALNCESFGWTAAEKGEPEAEPAETLYSKLKLMRACRDEGIWDDVKQGITDAGYMDEFMLAQELSSADPGFSSFIALMKAAKGEDVTERILAGSVLE